MWIGKRKRKGADGAVIEDATYSYKFTWTNPATGKAEQILRKTDHYNADEAEQDARAHLHSLRHGAYDLARQLRRRRAPVKSSLAEILAAYVGAPPAPKRANEKTRALNVNAIARMYQKRHGLILDTDPAAEADQPGRISALHVDASQLSDTFVWEWKQKIQADAGAEDDEERQQQIFRSANSTLRQAQSVFSADFLEYYTFEAKLILPESVRKFAAAPEFRGVAKREYHAPPDAIVRATLQQLENFRDSDRNIFIACWLAIGYGLRASEIREARKGWFMEISGEPWCSGDVLAKNKKFPRVRAQLGAWEKLRPLLDELPADAYVITGTATERTDTVFRRISEWMKTLGWQTEHHVHEFRAWAGAQIAENSPRGLLDAQTFLRHQHYNTTENYYGQHMKRRLAEVKVNLPAATPFVPKIVGSI